MSQDSPSETHTTYCYVHPDREALLRCNRCDRPICTQCAVLTPTGYRCKECIRGQQKIFNTANTIDYPVAFVTAGILSLIGSIIAGFLGFWVIFLAPAAGVGTAEVVRWTIHRHRANSLFLTAALGAAAGALPVILANLLVGRNLLGMIWPVAYAVLIVPSVYYRLKGISIG
jgi:hypothetical protein